MSFVKVVVILIR